MPPTLVLLADAASPHTRRWARAFADCDWNVQVISLRDGEIPGVQVHVLPLARTGIIGILGLRSRLRRLLAKLAPDLVHAHYATSYGLLGAIGGHHPFVLSLWGSDVYEFPRKSPLHRALLAYNLACADALCATSQDMIREAGPYLRPGQAILHTPFGIDPDRFSPTQQDLPGRKEGPRAEFTLGAIKALEWRYGLDDLIRALAILEPEFPGLRLALVGEGPQQADLQRLAAQLGVTGHVQFLGQLPSSQLPDFYRSLYLLVVPSLLESFGVCVLEAQACGVPVVASRVGGLPEVLEEGKTGLLVPPRDPEALAGAIATLLRDPSLRQRMGEVARAFVLDRYRWEDSVAIMARLYERLLLASPKSKASSSQFGE